MEILFQDILKFATTYLTPVMICAFIFGIALRFLIYYTIKREDWFISEFKRRVHYFLEEDNEKSDFSFYITTKQILEKSFYEAFMMRSIMKRRKSDIIATFTDRIFLTQQGAAFIVKNTLKQIKYLKHNSGQPKMLEIAKSVCQNNPCFGKLFGFIPLNVNDILNVLPGIFVIGGIFGTFLGIMEGLHSLTSIDIADVEGTQSIMNRFLSHVAFSMTTSIVGIILSVTMTLINTIFSPEKLFIGLVERYENTLDIIWNRSANNHLPKDIKGFDENKDPALALAEIAVNKEYASSKFSSNKNKVYGQHLIDDNINKINEKEKTIIKTKEKIKIKSKNIQKVKKAA